MMYPKDFVAKAKKIFPDWKQLHEWLDAENPIVGRALADAPSPTSLTGEEVIQRWKAGRTVAEVEAEIDGLKTKNLELEALRDWWRRIQAQSPPSFPPRRHPSF